MLPLFLYALVDSWTLLWPKAWQDTLGQEDRVKADRLACEYAKRCFNRDLDQLTVSELQTVQSLVEANFHKY